MNLPFIVAATLTANETIITFLSKRMSEYRERNFHINFRAINWDLSNFITRNHKLITSKPSIPDTIRRMFAKLAQFADFPVANIKCR